MFDVTNS